MKASRDFGVYYAAAASVSHGLNPYNMEALQSSLPSNSLPFVYPLLTAHLFRPFLIVPFESAAIFYALIKVVCLVYLIRLWADNFLPKAKTNGEIIIVGLVLAFGLSLTMYADFAGGNVSIIEQTLLWTGLLFFVRGRLGLFCAFVVLAASFKFTLSLALLLLLATDYRWRRPLMYLSFAALALVPAISYLLNPTYLGEYLGLLSLQAGAQRGFTNPSLSSALIDFPFIASVKLLPLVLYACAVVVVIAQTILTIRHGISRTEAVLLFTAAYALAMPRMSPYSYIILLPAISYLFLAWRVQLPDWALPAAAIVAPIVLSAPAFRGSIFSPWIEWITNFHLAVLSGFCFVWWTAKLRHAYPSFSTLTARAAMPNKAAPICSSVPESAPM